MAHGVGAPPMPRDRRALVRGRRGITSAVFALALVALLGAVGLGSDAGVWYQDWVQVQGVADAAAMAGAVSVAIPAEQPYGGPVATATYVATQNGYTSGSGGVTVTVNYPPTSGSYKGSVYAVEVIVGKTETLEFARLFLGSGPTLTGRSVAVYSANKGTCMLALGKTTSSGNNGEFYVDGNAYVSAPDCTVASNSNNSANAMELTGGTNITAYTARAVGGIDCASVTGGCSAGFTLNMPYSADTVPTADPLAAVQNVPLPPSSAFTGTNCQTMGASPQPGCYNNTSISSSTTTLPGGTYVLNGGLSLSGSGTVVNIGATAAGSTFYINGNIYIGGSATLNFAPGTYFINDGSLTVAGQGSLICSACVAGGAGATFVLMGDNPGIVSTSGTSQTVAFSAPTNSNYNAGLDGIAIYEVPTDTQTNKLSGGSSLSVQGAMYTPGAALDISGNGLSATPTCSVYVANSITLSGNGYATDQQCAADGYGWADTPTPSGITLAQ